MYEECSRAPGRQPLGSATSIFVHQLRWCYFWFATPLCNLAAKESSSCFQTFFQHLPDVLASPASLRGVKLDVRSPHNRAVEMSLGPHCQCRGHEQVGSNSKIIQVKWNRGKKRNVKVPSYVLGPSSDIIKRKKECTKAWLAKTALVDVPPRCLLLGRVVGSKVTPGDIMTCMYRRDIVPKRMPPVFMTIFIL
jgi:hypothetical protein